MSERANKDLRDHDIAMAEQGIWMGINKLVELGCSNILRELHSDLGKLLKPRNVESAREN